MKNPERKKMVRRKRMEGLGMKMEVLRRKRMEGLGMKMEDLRRKRMEASRGKRKNPRTVERRKATPSG